MKKKVIAAIVSLVMAVGTIGSVSVTAAEVLTTQEAAETEQVTEQDSETTEQVELESDETERNENASEAADQKDAALAVEADTSIEATMEEPETDQESDTSTTAASYDGLQEESASQGETAYVVNDDVDKSQGEAATTEEIVEEVVQEEKTPAEAAVVTEKMIDYGEAGTVEYFPADNPVRTNGFADDPVVDISTGRISAHAEGSNANNVLIYNGDYQKVVLNVAISKSRLKDPSSTKSDYYLFSEDTKKYNPTKFEVTGPDVKKTLVKEAYDWDYVHDSVNSDNCLRFPDYYIGHYCFHFDHVSSDNLAKRLKLRTDKHGADFGVNLHEYIMDKVKDFPLETLRQYETAREFAEAEGLLEDDRKFVCFQESDNKYYSEKESIEEKIARLTEYYDAAGYRTEISTKYGYFIGLDPDSEYISTFEEKRKEGRVSATVVKDGKYWASWLEYDNASDARWQGPQYTEVWLKDLFGEDVSIDYEVKLAPFDVKTYYVQYEFSYADVVEAWLEEMDGWDGHWKYLLYGPSAVPEMKDDEGEPGYYKINWAMPTSYVGKITLHYPDQYDFYVKEPGTYTVTATIDGCSGEIRDQFKVVKDIASCTISGIEEKRYTEDEIRKALVVKDGDKTLTLDTDYTVTCTDYWDGSVYRVSINGVGLYTHTVEKTLPYIDEEIPGDDTPGDDTPGDDTPGDVDPVSALGASKKVTVYNVAQGLKVTWLKVDGATRYKVYRDGALIKTTSRLEITDGDVKYAYGQKFTYAVVATSKETGDSEKRRTGTYYRLKPVGIKRLSNYSAGKIAVDYDYSYGNSGYVIRFGIESDMSDAKVITVPANTTRRILSGLKKGKTYYVQVRAYRIEDGIRYYSGYCTTKSITVAK